MPRTGERLPTYEIDMPLEAFEPSHIMMPIGTRKRDQPRRAFRSPLGPPPTSSPPVSQLNPDPSSRPTQGIPNLSPAPLSPSSRQSQPSGSPVPSTQSVPNLPSRDLWEKAGQRLFKEDKETVLKHVSVGIDSMPEALLNAAKAKQKICHDKRWNFKFKGHTVSLRDAADRVIVWLEKFKAVGDVAINADPIHAGLPWAGIRLLLQATVSERQQMGILLLGLDRVLYIINRCKVYEILYPPDSDLSNAGQNLESALTDLYLLILQFLSKAIRLYERSTASRAFKAFWDPDEIIDFENRCQDLEMRVDIEVQNCERFYNKIERVESLQQAKTLKVLLQELNKLKDPIGRVDTRVTELWKILNEVERSNILIWTSDIPYQDHHTIACKGRTKDTGEWLFEHRQYKVWQSSDESMILWLHGIPGAGKTKLVSRVIDHISSNSHNQALAYFYCNRNEKICQDPENILRSFVKQLSISLDENAIQNALVEVYKKKQRMGFASARLTFEESQSLLLILIQAYSQIVLILDALDESKKKTRGDLIECFNYLINKSQHLKIFISSRRDDDIKRQLEKKTNIGIEATDNENDISRFVAEKIDQGQKRRRRAISEDLRNKIIHTLLKRSQGMFQWAALQIDQVISLERERDIQDRLGRLPKDLKTAYDEIYTQITTAEGSKSEVAIRAFQWVMCSCEPLVAEALVAAVCQNPEEEGSQPVDIDVDFVLDACHNLLIIDTRLRVWRFSHLSVQEYFEEHHWNSCQTHGTVAKVCLSLLNDHDNWVRGSGNKDTNLRDTDLSDTRWSDPLAKLLDYARIFWPIHVKNHGETDIDNKLTKELEKFLGSTNESGPAYRSWHQMRRLSSNPAVLRLSVKELTPNTMSSLAICLFGFNNVLAEWWDAGSMNVEQQNKLNHSLLVLAVLGSSSGVIKKLLDLGADVNTQLSDEKYGNALTAAAKGGNEHVVQLLLDSGADVNMQLSSGEYGSALAVAAARGNEYIVQLLLDSGADINMQLSSGEYGSALAAAAAVAWKDNRYIVQVLLDSGADVNMQLSSGEYGSALAAAAEGGDEYIVQLLLNSGADINMQLSSGEYGSALAAAAEGGNEHVVQLLLDSGADVNMQLSSGIYGSALAAAAAVKHNEHIVQLLLDSGADVNMQLSSGHYGSALAAAAQGNIEQHTVQLSGEDNWPAVVAAVKNKHIVEQILDSGTEVNMHLSSGEYGSALAAAAAAAEEEEKDQGGNKYVVQLLLDSGADVNMQLSSGMYGSALAAAAWKGNECIVQQLLDSGADVNMQLSSGEYGSALAAAVAAWKGDEHVIQLLLDSGADVNMQLSNGEYGSALAAAAWKGNECIVQQLLDSGADVNMQLSSGEYGSALAAAVAAWKGDEHVVQLLLDSGADVNMQLSSGSYGSALAAAVWWGDEHIVQLLLDSGADVNMQLRSGIFGSALAAAAAMAAAAAEGGDEHIVQLLLDSGADVNMQLRSGIFGSAFAAAAAVAATAAEGGNEHVLQQLLDSGADANMQLSSGSGSALASAPAVAAAAAEGGNEHVLQQHDEGR